MLWKAISHLQCNDEAYDSNPGYRPLQNPTLLNQDALFLPMILFRSAYTQDDYCT
jgi:hypothetical protein